MFLFYFIIFKYSVINLPNRISYVFTKAPCSNSSASFKDSRRRISIASAPYLLLCLSYSIRWSGIYSTSFALSTSLSNCPELDFTYYDLKKLNSTFVVCSVKFINSEVRVRINYFLP